MVPGESHKIGGVEASKDTVGHLSRDSASGGDLVFCLDIRRFQQGVWAFHRVVDSEEC